EPRAYRPAGHEVVLYACHGVFNPIAPLASKLLLAPEREAYAPGDPRVPDGNFHAWEVLLTDHSGVELVVLGACETLLPAFRNLQGTLAVLAGEECERVELTAEQLEDITSGDEVVGLVRAFLSTGAQSVLATLWQANPLAVEALLVRAAEHRLAGKSWAQALTLAQRELLQSHAFAHPWFWAPYQLVGRWR
ncbi:MAG: CHAT domain-containing protein, partial [Candidatus Bipolaricaulota bacterium]|nr:CHAT domain-containing protein [Candidatus Bipolaricaulota bacterium]MDW8127167.1 CHAT domain-containing protein [Candidatus Bipolaricaulota bacterium]